MRELFEAQVERALRRWPSSSETDTDISRTECASQSDGDGSGQTRVGPEALVAVLAERGTGFLITMLAVFKAGRAYPTRSTSPDSAHRSGAESERGLRSGGGC